MKVHSKRQRQAMWIALVGCFVVVGLIRAAAFFRRSSLDSVEAAAHAGARPGVQSGAQPIAQPTAKPKGETEPLPPPDSGAQRPLDDPLQPREEMMALIKAESEEVDRLQSDPFAAEKRLREQAQALTKADRQWLAHQAVSEEASPQARFLALGLLKRDARRSLAQLEAIATTPLDAKRAQKHDGDLRHERSLAVRISALEGIESIAIANPTARERLGRIASRAKDRAVAEAAAWSESEAAEGRSFFARYAKLMSRGERRQGEGR